MNLDVSPDYIEIVFDMLDDIYAIQKPVPFVSIDLNFPIKKPHPKDEVFL